MCTEFGGEAAWKIMAWKMIQEIYIKMDHNERQI
jgi:hypothetical protein